MEIFTNPTIIFKYNNYYVLTGKLMNIRIHFNM